ncbi:hypothetical protein NIES267_01420 [Calothrix parasitica NIES-267]|uniref:Uncharacterized protein n=1 Tax=Calothrix parasitica NIES-267 TaxID=1973488 RepID=A0A1Z4LHF5_9CYAN|nr:hypothetical protein NIES267_01420 [Calothrix parasitica NIES-267]
MHLLSKCLYLDSHQINGLSFVEEFKFKISHNQIGELCTN